MENEVKGTRYDVRNNHWYCQHCRNGYQHHRYDNQHYTIHSET